MKPFDLWADCQPMDKLVGLRKWQARFSKHSYSLVKICLFSLRTQEMWYCHFCWSLGIVDIPSQGIPSNLVKTTPPHFRNSRVFERLICQSPLCMDNNLSSALICVCVCVCVWCDVKGYHWTCHTPFCVQQVKPDEEVPLVPRWWARRGMIEKVETITSITIPISLDGTSHF